MIKEVLTSRRDFLAAGAATATGLLLSPESIQGSNAATQPCGLPGIPTGFQHIDGLTGGLHRSELTLLASRPGMGNTALALNFTDFASVEAAVPTLYFSLGTSRVEIARRLICSRGGVRHSALHYGTVSSDVGQRLTQAGAELSEGPMYLDDKPLRTVADIRSIAKQLNDRLTPKHQLGLLVVDYLQRVEAEHHTQTLDEHLIDVAYELRSLAQELNVAVLGLQQLTCLPSTVHESPPAPAALRGTQYAADIVLLLHRPGPELALKEAERPGFDTGAQLSLIDRRDRLAEIVELSWNSQYTRFTEPNAWV